MTPIARLATRLNRRAGKVAHALGSARGRRGLALGAAAATEHRGALHEIAEAFGPGRGPDTVVDVGANAGQFALAAREAFPHARLISFEPLPGPAARFERLFADAEGVRLHRCALAAEAGTAPMTVTARDDSSSLLRPARQTQIYPRTAPIGEIAVPVRRLDAFAAEITGPALLKLDVQGGELDALRGAEGLLGRFAHVYAELSFMELYTGQPLARDVIGWLAARGFGLVSVHAGDEGRDRRGRAVQADFLFARAEATRR